MTLMSVVVFLAFNLYNEYVITRERKKNDQNAALTDRDAALKDSLARKGMRTKNRKGKEFYKSPFTAAGYVLMLLFRLSFEIFFLWLENQLGKHQSQNTEFWNSFWLKESWQCATNDPRQTHQDSLDKVLPPSNRSEIFWTDDYNMACLQQQISVTCWIPLARMKSFGLIFMYWVLIISTCLTCLELAFELLKLCKSRPSPITAQQNLARQVATAPRPEEIPIINMSPDFHHSDTMKASDPELILPERPSVSDDKAAIANEEAVAKIYPVVAEAAPVKTIEQS